jgi:hypothetical protein
MRKVPRLGEAHLMRAAHAQALAPLVRRGCAYAAAAEPGDQAKRLQQPPHAPAHAPAARAPGTRGRCSAGRHAPMSKVRSELCARSGLHAGSIRPQHSTAYSAVHRLERRERGRRVCRVPESDDCAVTQRAAVALVRRGLRLRLCPRRRLLGCLEPRLGLLRRVGALLGRGAAPLLASHRMAL